MGGFPAGQPSPNRNLRPLADADLTANETDSQFAYAQHISEACSSSPPSLRDLPLSMRKTNLARAMIFS
jgi:hypothetical protein